VKKAAFITVSMLALSAATARAQDFQTPPPAKLGSTSNAPSEQGLSPGEVAFTAAQLDYDDNTEIVTASGDVRMVRDGNKLRADKVVWNRKTGAMTAIGNVAATNPGGDTAYADKIDLTDSLRDGVAENILLVLENGGRLAAQSGTRTNGVTVLQNAAYTPCAVTDSDNCPKQPLWQITASKVIDDPSKGRISYRDARLRLLGVPILWLPALSHPDGSGGKGGSGLLVPDVGYSSGNGVELAVPYYIRFAPNRDLTLTPHVYSSVLPALEARFRDLNSFGAYQVGGFLTYGSRLPASASRGLSAAERQRDFRGYFDGSGRFQFSPEWSLSASARWTTDKTFPRRYDISNDDRLRTMFDLQRIDADSLLSISGWAVQSLRANARQGQQPIALPLIDYRRRIEDPLLGGVIQLTGNTLALTRTDGQDTRRAFAGAQWDVRRLTPWGQELTFTAYARGDVYNSHDAEATAIVPYRGENGWQTRGIAAFAADLRWPFAGEAFGGIQRITPRVQIVASPPTRNLAIPNEDARAVELEDSNLFALNRFSGYDRWEDGTRVTYGGEYALDLPRFSVRAVIGQSYRLTNKPQLFPDGTGLSRRFSDVVGRTDLRYGKLLTLTHRYRLDKDSLAFRRNEIEATVGSTGTYVTLGYLRLNRDIPRLFDDLRDREEVRAGARVQIAKRWSIYGSTVIDLTSASEDPTSTADGYEPVRHRVGVRYEDECFEFSASWRKDYDNSGDASRGNAFMFRLAFKNLGR
jgi:LPS-assembly protein